MNLDQAVETKQPSSPTYETSEEGSIQLVDQQPENKNQVTVLVILKLFMNYHKRFLNNYRNLLYKLS